MVLAQLTPEESKVLSAVRLEEAMALWFLKSWWTGNQADMNEEDELQKLWDIGPRAHVATNFDFVSENEQMQILLKQEVLNQAEKLKCQIRYVDYKLKSIHDFIESLPCAFHSWALVRKTSAQSMEADLESPLQPVEATLGAAGTAVPSPRGPKPSKSGRARRAAVVTLSNGESIEEANKKAAQNLTLKVDFGDWYWGWFLIPPFWADFWWFGMIFSHSSINFCVDTWMNGNGRVNACTGAESSFFSCWCQETFWSWQFYRTWNEHHCWPVYLSGQPIFSRSLGPKIQGVTSLSQTDCSSALQQKWFERFVSTSMIPRLDCRIWMAS